jgi:DNA gyrase/topoisomerase IV subunit A
MYKLTTENNLECEDLTKINIEVKRKKEENKYLMNQLIKNKEINKNLKLEINNLKHNNNIVMNSLNNIL